MSKKEPLSSPPVNNILNEGLVVASEGSFLDNQNYLVTDHFAPVLREWSTLFHTENMTLDLSTNHSFTITLGLKYAGFIDPEDDLNIAKVFLGIKDQQRAYQECIEMGLYMGRLYIRDIFDVVTISKEKLVEGIHMVLTVNPGADSKSITKLKALDQSGVILSKIKTRKLLSSDWNGGISTGAHFKFLRIEGIQSTY